MRSRCLVPLCYCLTGLLGLVGLLTSSANGEVPRVHDARLELNLVAEHPDIVTPVGMAIDNSDRLFVIESHTHHPAADYQGPKTDLVKVFGGPEPGGQGSPKLLGTFADGLDAAMNLAFSPDGVLYVACARDVWALPDRNRDGVCDGKERVLELVTGQKYAHNCLMGITFDSEGFLYISRGNVGSMEHTLRGTDGSTVSGYGDGGSVCRCRSDGSQLEPFATGFWNPFDIMFDGAGRLLCADNDPDGRGPNRLVHVVQAGDYGYRSLYGGSGNHPFQGWDADLPGLLPLVSGTGEAPSGILDCTRSNLPTDYAASLLVTVWNENTIERHEVVPSGLSIEAKRSILVSGGQDFRPVAIDTDSKGDIYFTDWVLVQYPNHGRGRIWRINVKPEFASQTPRMLFAEYGSNAYRAAAEAGMDPESIRDALSSDDLFERHLGVLALVPHIGDDLWRQLLTDPDPRLRLGSLIALQAKGDPPAEALAKRYLGDLDPEVRRAALIWVGQSLKPSLSRLLDSAIRGPAASGPIFESYLAAVQNLDPTFVEQHRTRAHGHANRIPRVHDDALLRSIARDVSFTSDIRGLAISHLSNMRSPENQTMVLAVLREELEPIRLAAIRRVASEGEPEIERLLMSLAVDSSQGVLLRAEAVAALAYAMSIDVERLLELLDDPNQAIAIEAARTLRNTALDSAILHQIRTKRAALTNTAAAAQLVEQLDFCLAEGQSHNRPNSLAEWQAELARGGSSGRGRRVFYSPHATCSKCHTIGGRGGTLGPDLSHIAQSVSRAQIVQSILEPSAQFPPQYQQWQIVTTDGRVHAGLQLDHKARGDIELFTTEGKTVHFRADEIESYAASPNSVMPNGLEANLGLYEFRDLVRFLSADDED